MREYESFVCPLKSEVLAPNRLEITDQLCDKMRAVMSDQSDNNVILNFIATTIETMRDQMATKDDLARLEARLETKLEVEITAVRGDIEQVHLRLDAIEKALSSRLGQIEAEMSRLRSVVYLLVKDRPDMLRLLGQTSS
jgi:hypothetical protein